ncbi:hypothetical protein D917_05958 [Trichinella nativa]|uniref:Uncharacterized protein n=1 Tax=Trichinella nativa TaxID=6335 RepID=A0A1Y3EUF0_9BILA|nr:hypothetical protein D917_05958 [Trichinella nativa]
MNVVAVANNAAAIPQDETLPASVSSSNAPYSDSFQRITCFPRVKCDEAIIDDILIFPETSSKFDG